MAGEATSRSWQVCNRVDLNIVDDPTGTPGRYLRLVATGASSPVWATVWLNEGEARALFEALGEALNEVTF